MCAPWLSIFIPVVNLGQSGGPIEIKLPVDLPGFDHVVYNAGYALCLAEPKVL